MLPLGDSPRTTRAPLVNLTLIAINALVFLYELSLGPRLDRFLITWGVVPARVTSALAAPGANHVALLTLVTAMFLHAGWLHIAGNMLFLWIFGDNVEDRLGHGRYLAFYFACGIAANLAQVYANPSSTIAGVGASGAIAGVLGAYLVTFPGARVSVLLPVLFFFGLFEIPALIVIGFWFVTQLFSGVAALADATARTGGIAWWAHVGGFLFGAVVMLLLPKSAPTRSYDGSVSFEQRAREDTGLIGLAVGTVSLVSHVIQLVLLARLVIVFLGVRQIIALVPFALQIVQDTTPFLRPFVRVVPGLRLGAHFLELYTLAAVLFVYVVGAALIWVIASTVYRPARASRHRTVA